MLLPGLRSFNPTDTTLTAGLSKTEVEFLLLPELDDAWKPNTPLGLDFSKVKSSILDFVETPAFLESEKLWPFLCVTQETCPAGVADRARERQ